jgi:hypothetical protein
MKTMRISGESFEKSRTAAPRPPKDKEHFPGLDQPMEVVQDLHLLPLSPTEEVGEELGDRQCPRGYRWLVL